MKRATKADDNPTAASYGSLARRIAAWTSNGLMTAIVLVAALAFGRQVLVWWSEGKTSPVGPVRRTGPTSAAGDRLEFGAAGWSMVRKTTAGDARAATAALVALCRSLLEGHDGDRSVFSATSPRPRQTQTAEKSTGPRPLPAGLLADLAARKPIAAEPGNWQLFALDERLPLVVAVAPGVEATGEKRPDPAGTNLAPSACRVVIWGLGLSAGPRAWTLYAWQPHGTGAAGGAGGTGSASVATGGTGSASVGQGAAAADIPLPPESVRILSIEAADGGTVAAFVGSPQPQTWRQFYAAWFAAHGWTTVTAWHGAGSQDYARFLAPPGSRRAAAEIRFAPDERGDLRRRVDRHARKLRTAVRQRCRVSRVACDALITMKLHHDESPL